MSYAKLERLSIPNLDLRKKYRESSNQVRQILAPFAN